MVPADKKRMLIKSARQHNTGFANRCVSALQFGPCGAKRGFWSEVQPPVHHNFRFSTAPVRTCHAHRQYLEMQRRHMVCFLHNFKSHTWCSYLKPCFCYQKLNINIIIENKIPKVYISEQCASVSLSSGKKEVRKSWLSIYLYFDSLSHFHL